MSECQVNGGVEGQRRPLPRDFECGCFYGGLCATDPSLLDGTPFGSWYVDGHQREFVPFEVNMVDDLKADPLVRGSNLIGPTDRNTPYPMAAALSSKEQVIDLCTPNTEWGGGYAVRQGTYLNIGAQAHAPLEMPRYSYAAIDTDALLQQAEENVNARLDFFK